MRSLMLLAGVGALALAMPVLALDQDRGRGGRGGPAAEAKQKGGGDRAERRRGGGEAQAERRGRGNAERAAGKGREARDERRADRRVERRAERATREPRREGRQARRADDRFEARRPIREARREDRRDWRRWLVRRSDRRGDRARLVPARGFCPPGLAMQNRFCMPPGQLRKARLIGERLPLVRAAYNVPVRYRYRFADDGDWLYRYDAAGYVYRFDRDNGLVAAVFPLFASDLMVGEPLPLGYEVYNVPLAYRSYYPDSADYRYRYDDGAIYRIDPQTRLVESIVALLTGGVGGLGALGVGDMLPTGYDAYNVPLEHRDTYYDSDEHLYRYADGALYQVDPQTRLIEAVISLLA